MQIGYYYASADRTVQMNLYLDPGYRPLDKLPVQRPSDGAVVECIRVSDMILECFKADGGCGSYDCHRQNLGTCGCGHHKSVYLQPHNPSRGDQP